jgi:hypothetical protein
MPMIVSLISLNPVSITHVHQLFQWITLFSHMLLVLILTIYCIVMHHLLDKVCSLIANS